MWRRHGIVFKRRKSFMFSSNGPLRGGDSSTIVSGRAMSGPSSSTPYGARSVSRQDGWRTCWKASLSRHGGADVR
jgi:hypothetical protein